jgi:hypothetical protein
MSTRTDEQNIIAAKNRDILELLKRLDFADGIIHDLIFRAGLYPEHRYASDMRKKISESSMRYRQLKIPRKGDICIHGYPILDCWCSLNATLQENRCACGNYGPLRRGLCLQCYHPTPNPTGDNP